MHTCNYCSCRIQLNTTTKNEYTFIVDNKSMHKPNPHLSHNINTGDIGINKNNEQNRIE